MSILGDLINATVTRLNAGSFSESFTAEKRLLPRRELEDITALMVDVFPGSEEWERQARSGVFTKTHNVSIAIQAPITSDANATFETYLALADEILADLSSITNLGGRLIDGFEREGPYSYDFAETLGVFLTMITIRFKGF